jgi:hypothetical protein
LTYFFYGLLGVDGSQEAVGNEQGMVEDEVDVRHGPINYIRTLPAVSKHGWGSGHITVLITHIIQAAVVERLRMLLRYTEREVLSSILYQVN